MKNNNSNNQEINFYVSQAKLLKDEISIPRLQNDLKIGFQKASAVFEKLKSVPGIELAITPELEESVDSKFSTALSTEIDRADFVHTGLSEVEATPENPVIIPCVLPGKDAHIVFPAEIQEIQKELSDAIEVETAELAIVEAACQPMNLGQALGEVLRDFDLGPNLTQCRPLEGTSDLKIGRALTVLSGVRNWTELGMGDAINELEDRGHKNVIPQIVSFLNLEDSHSTLDKYSRVARNVPNDLRELPGLHFTHLAEAGCSKFSKDPEEQKKAIRDVLTEASEKSLNVAQTRELCLVKKGKSTTPTPPPAQKKHGRFIVVSKVECEHSYSTDQLPEPDKDHIVIDTFEGSISCNACHGLPTWIPLPMEELEATVSEVVVEE